jgi:RNA polymerase sigma factor (sigma-70 family)
MLRTRRLPHEKIGNDPGWGDVLEIMTSKVRSAEDLLRHAGWLRRLAASLLADRDAGDDIAQETMVAALRRPPAADRDPRPWLTAVATNTARDFARAEARRVAREEAAHREAGAEVSTPEQLVGTAETYRTVAEVVCGLEEPFRHTLVLRYYDGLSSADIARRLGLPQGTVRARLKRGLDRVRAELDARHAGDRRAWARALLPLLPARPRSGTPLLKGALAALGTVAATVTVAVLAKAPGQTDAARAAAAAHQAKGSGAASFSATALAPRPAIASLDPALLECRAKLRLAHQELVALEADLVAWDSDFLFALGDVNPAAEAALVPLVRPLLTGPRQYVLEHRFHCRTWDCRLAVRLGAASVDSANWRAWRSRQRVASDPEIATRVFGVDGRFQQWEADLMEGDGAFVFVMDLRLRQPSGAPLPGARLSPPARELVLPATAARCEVAAAALAGEIPARRARWEAVEPLDRRFERSADPPEPGLERVVEDRQPWFTNLLANTECRGRVCKQTSRYPLLGRGVWGKSAGRGRVLWQRSDVIYHEPEP